MIICIDKTTGKTSAWRELLGSESRKWVWSERQGCRSRQVNRWTGRESGGHINSREIKAPRMVGVRILDAHTDDWLAC